MTLSPRFKELLLYNLLEIWKNVRGVSGFLFTVVFLLDRNAKGCQSKSSLVRVTAHTWYHSEINKWIYKYVENRIKISSVPKGDSWNRIIIQRHMSLLLTQTLLLNTQICAIMKFSHLRYFILCHIKTIALHIFFYFITIKLYLPR